MGDEAEYQISRLTSLPRTAKFRRAQTEFEQRERVNMPVPARRGRPAAKAAPTRKPVAKAGKDVTVYASKPATPYQKAFAKWLVTEVGFDPNTAPSLRAAFLKGVSLATSARSAFQSSDAAEAFWETSGETKRGPKPKVEQEVAPVPTRTRRAKPAPAPEPEPEDDEDEWEDEDEEAEDDTDAEDDDDAEEADDTEEDEWEDEEPAPAPKPRARTAAKSSAPAARSGTARKAAPAPAAKRTPAKRAPAKTAPADDDDFVF
jgi:hypothetical protein